MPSAGHPTVRAEPRPASRGAGRPPWLRGRPLRAPSTSRRPAKSDNEAPDGDQGFRGQPVGVEDLAVQSAAWSSGRSAWVSRATTSSTRRGLGSVEEEKRGDTSGRGVAEEGADLQLEPFEGEARRWPGRRRPRPSARPAPRRARCCVHLPCHLEVRALLDPVLLPEDLLLAEVLNVRASRDDQPVLGDVGAPVEGHRGRSLYSTICPPRSASASWALRAIRTRPLCTTAWVSACVMKSSIPGSCGPVLQDRDVDGA